MVYIIMCNWCQQTALTRGFKTGVELSFAQVRVGIDYLVANGTSEQKK